MATVQIRQQKAASINSNSAAGTISVTFTAPVLAGSAIWVCVGCDDTNVISAVSDNINGSYGAAIDSITGADGGATLRAAHYFKANVLAGQTTVTFTVTATIDVYLVLWAVEFTNVRTSPLDGHTITTQATPGTGTDGVTGSASSSNQPALVTAIAVNQHDEAAGTSGQAPTAGTGFTLGMSGWLSDAISEYKRVTATGSQTATATAVQNVTHFLYLVNVDETTLSITATPQNQEVCAGQTATFSVTATGSGTVHYQWRKNGANVGTDSSSYTTPATTTADNGALYDVVITDDTSSFTTAAALLTVRVCPSVAWWKG